jgi:hypothetical protein
MLNVIKLSVVMLNVIMLNVVAPFSQKREKDFLIFQIKISLTAYVQNLYYKTFLMVCLFHPSPIFSSKAKANSSGLFYGVRSCPCLQILD